MNFSPSLNVSDIYAVPVLLIAAALSFVFGIAPTHVLAGKLLQVSDRSSEAIAKVAQQRRITPITQFLYVGIGAAIGLAVGFLMYGLIGWQGLLLGGVLAVGAAILPFSRYEDGWDKKWVETVNAGTLRLLRMVYILSGSGGKPIDEAIRYFGRTWQGRSPLADLVMDCPQSESPAEFLGRLGVPGQPYAVTVLALQQGRQMGQEARNVMLEQNLHMALSDLENELGAMAKRRVLLTIISTILILLPTLMLAVLAPPASQLVHLVSF